MATVAALVTGASSGIGLHYAGQLAEMGYNLIMVSNQQEQLSEAAAAIARKKREIKVIDICKDLSEPSSAQELFNYCCSNNIEVQVLINNAGIFIFRDIAECSTEKISTILNLHMYTVTMLCRLFGERMRQHGKGYILNMSSVCVHTPYPGISLYAATKSYIKSMSIALRLEMKEFGVRVMAVSPGAVATGLYNLPENLQQLGIKIGVIYRPEKLARKALHKLFCSNRKEYIPGAINHLYRPVYSILPDWFKMWVRRKILKYMHKQ